VGIGIGIALVYTPSIACVQPWFTRRRGLAAGIASAGIGAGTLVVSGSNTTSGFRIGASAASPTNGGTVILSQAASSGTNQLQFNYGTLQAAVPLTFANGLSIGGRTGAVAVIGGTAATTFSGS
jgi:hypothetical protein